MVLLISGAVFLPILVGATGDQEVEGLILTGSSNILS